MAVAGPAGSFMPFDGLAVGEVGVVFGGVVFGGVVSGCIRVTRLSGGSRVVVVGGCVKPEPWQRCSCSALFEPRDDGFGHCPRRSIGVDYITHGDRYSRFNHVE